jgi:hypothetical protein
MVDGVYTGTRADFDRSADQVITFEDFGLPPNSFDNNAGLSGQFVVEGSPFNNSYDAIFSTWSG